MNCIQVRWGVSADSASAPVAGVPVAGVPVCAKGVQRLRDRNVRAKQNLRPIESSEREIPV